MVASRQIVISYRSCQKNSSSIKDAQILLRDFKEQKKKKKKLERKKNIEDMLGMVAHLRKIRVQSPINFPHSVVDSIV